MTDREEKALTKRALRNVRRLNRTLQTQSEKLERRLDRNIDQKGRYRPHQGTLLARDFDPLALVMSALDKSMVDAITSIATFN